MATATPTTPAIRSTLPETARQITGIALQGALVDLLNLSLLAKQAHWTIVGPRFRSLHLQLDEIVTTARSYADTVAERASAIGITPDGRAGTVAACTKLPQPEAGWIADDDVVSLLVEALGGTIGRMRERIAATDKPDPVTQDIFISLTAELEKQHWMFQAENH
ncbi:DNA starvation/stationary phase protection protein [Streptomyces spiroverticillatus]|uniref:DNA starvation/stationary phase protection protein n=1 Tax=Streptomyces finlayi TaxID=67296 RepID=A0A919CDL9_9ACTN|nr:DNA starvation/stationary phase protection protein [Streptomyces finlayi]GHA34233.1 DNA starvation/stationary phase protection protein [Streptomyces spiroverticillatus]GHD11807.1 DNA starvation/stationary phase protection protein [Streptomyces finlayi]